MNCVTEKRGTGFNRMLYEAPAITIGRFACHPGSDGFVGPQRIPVSQVIFPGRPVVVRRECGRRFLVDPTMAAIYRRGEEYERGRVGDFEDRHFWIGLSNDGFRSNLRLKAPPFVWRVTHFREQQSFFQRLESGNCTDPLEIEERAMGLIRGVMASANPTADRAPCHYGLVDRDLIQGVKERIAAIPEARLTLMELADDFELSPFSLFRAFRALTGWTIHRYATEMRLRLAWCLLSDTSRPITDIAIGTGFSSHSHFTASFHRRFGIPPNRHPARA